MSGYVEIVKSAIGEVLDLEDVSHIGPDTCPEADLGFDSGLYIELIMHLEDSVSGLKINPATLQRGDFRTVGKIAGFVARQLIIASGDQ